METSYRAVGAKRMPGTAFLAAAVLAGFIGIAPAGGDPQGAFPLRISPNNRYFVDRQGTPFLIQGDTAWSLIAQLTLREAGVYLDRRRVQGFNAILVNLIEHKFSSKAPRNAAGAAPFLTPGDLSTPNEAYFAHADQVIALAAERGMAVFLAPAYLGWRGGDEGWFKEVRRNGADRVRGYGKYIGSRLGPHANLVWVLGGDYTPAWLDRWTVDALAAGLHDSGVTQLMTAHCGQESPAKAFGRRRWLDFSNVYSYGPDLFAESLAEYQRQPTRPFVLLEAFYEGEHDASPELIRSQGYAALLAGAAGQFFGNNPVWNFDAPVKVFPSVLKWPEALESRGAREIGLLGKLFLGLRWYDLVPAGRSSPLSRRSDESGPGRLLPAAVSDDGGLFVAYVRGPAPGGLRMNPDGLIRPGEAFWFDPTNGKRTAIEPSAFSGQGQRTIPLPGKNADGADDWLLVFRAKGGGKAPGEHGEESGTWTGSVR